jgi:hypothetical protein
MPVKFVGYVGKAKAPCRSFNELAEEFGVSQNALAGYMSKFPGPAPRLTHKTDCARNSWYDPMEMRKWWKSVQIAITKPAE